MKMKLVIMAILISVIPMCIYAQTEQQKNTFEELKKKLTLDEDYGYSYIHVFENLNATKEELHARALSVFPYLVDGTYDARKIIQHESMEEGIIVAKVACNDLGTFSNLAHSYYVSANPILRIDIKENRVRLIMSVKKMYVYHLNASGIFIKKTNEEIPSTELPPFKLDKKKKVNTMYFSAFIKLYNTLFVFKEKFEDGLRTGNTGAKESKDDW